MSSYYDDYDEYESEEEYDSDDEEYDSDDEEDYDFDEDDSETYDRAIDTILDEDLIDSDEMKEKIEEYLDGQKDLSIALRDIDCDIDELKDFIDDDELSEYNSIEDYIQNNLRKVSGVVYGIATDRLVLEHCFESDYIIETAEDYWLEVSFDEDEYGESEEEFWAHEDIDD